MPVQALMELRKVAELLERRLPNVICPVMIVQGSDDPVVDPASAQVIDASVGATEKSLHMIQSDRHGILQDNIGDVQDLIVARLAKFASLQPSTKVASTSLMPRIGANIANLLFR